MHCTCFLVIYVLLITKMGSAGSKFSPPITVTRAITASEFRSFTITKVTQVTHNVKEYKIDVPLSGNLPVSSMIMVGQSVCDYAVYNS